VHRTASYNPPAVVVIHSSSHDMSRHKRRATDQAHASAQSVSAVVHGTGVSFVVQYPISFMIECSPEFSLMRHSPR